MIENPVLVKEMRTRLRGARAYWILFAYTGLLSTVLVVSYALWLQHIAQVGGGASQVGSLGRSLFGNLLITQWFLALFITPSITSAALTVEREQRTLDLLATTPLSRGGIVAGKLLTAFCFTGLLVLSSLPLVSVCFLLGGVDLAAVLGAYAELLAASLLAASIGLLWSAACSATTYAVLATYATVGALAIGAAALYGLSTSEGGVPPVPQLLGLQTVAQSWFGARLMGISVPAGTGFVLLCLLASAALAAAASARLHLVPAPHALPARLLTALALSVQVAAAGAWAANTPPVIPASPAAGSAVPCLALLVAGLALAIVVPIFTTREPHLAGDRVAALSSRLCAAAFAGCIVAAAFLVGLVHGTSGDSALAAMAAVVLFAFAVGLAELCGALSGLLRSRWAAWLAAFALLFTVWAVPSLASPSALGAQPTPVYALRYLNAVHTLAALSAASLGWHDATALDAGSAWITVLIWIVIGVIAAVWNARSRGRGDSAQLIWKLCLAVRTSVGGDS